MFGDVGQIHAGDAFRDTQENNMFFHAAHCGVFSHWGEHLAVMEL